MTLKDPGLTSACRSLHQLQIAVLNRISEALGVSMYLGERDRLRQLHTAGAFFPGSWIEILCLIGCGLHEKTISGLSQASRDVLELRVFTELDRTKLKSIAGRILSSHTNLSSACPSCLLERRPGTQALKYVQDSCRSCSFCSWKAAATEDLPPFACTRGLLCQAIRRRNQYPGIDEMYITGGGTQSLMGVLLNLLCPPTTPRNN